MPGPFSIALSVSLLAALVNLTGLFAIRRFTDWGRANSVHFAAFAAGLLIAAAFLKLIPEAVRLAPAAAPLLMLVGYLLLLGVGQLIGDPEHTPHEERRAVALLPVVGIALHSLSDGVVYSVAFTVGTQTGILAALGLVLHEFPEGIIAYVLLLRGGLAVPRAFLLAFLAAAATTPLGMLVSYPLISDLTGAPLGGVLALTAGALIYVGASHLVPHVEHGAVRGSAWAFLAGIFVALAMAAVHGL